MIAMRAAWLVGVVALAGCSVPEKGGFEAVERSSAELVPARVHWYQGTPEDEAVESSVEALLARELSVEEAVQIALLNNRSLQARYEELGVSQADLVQAGLLENPVFFGHVGIPDGGQVVELSFEVMTSFLDLLLLPSRKRLAEYEFEGAKLRVSQAVLDLASETRSAYWRLQGSLQAAEVSRTIAQAARASWEFAERQEEAGNVSDLEIARRRLDHEEAKIDLARSEFEVLAGRERMNRLLGVWGPLAGWTIPAALPPVPAEEVAFEELERRAVERRFDLAAARLGAERLSAAVEIARDWRWIGRLDAGGEVDREIDDVVVSGPMIELQLPIFDQGQARIARLEAELRRARREAEALAIEIRSEVRELAYRVLLARRTAEHYRTVLVPLRERLVEVSRRHYDFMLIGVHELLEARRLEVEAYREYVAAVRDYWVARAELERAAGGPLTGEKP